MHRKLMNYPIINTLTWKLFPFDSRFPNLDLNADEEYQWFLMSVEDGYLSKYIFLSLALAFLLWELLLAFVK